MCDRETTYLASFFLAKLIQATVKGMLLCSMFIATLAGPVSRHHRDLGNEVRLQSVEAAVARCDSMVGQGSSRGLAWRVLPLLFVCPLLPRKHALKQRHWDDCLDRASPCGKTRS